MGTIFHKSWWHTHKTSTWIALVSHFDSLTLLYIEKYIQVWYKDVPLQLKVQLHAFCRVGTSWLPGRFSWYIFIRRNGIFDLDFQNILYPYKILWNTVIESYKNSYPHLHGPPSYCPHAINLPLVKRYQQSWTWRHFLKVLLFFENVWYCRYIMEIISKKSIKIHLLTLPTVTKKNCSLKCDILGKRYQMTFEPVKALFFHRTIGKLFFWVPAHNIC